MRSPSRPPESNQLLTFVVLALLSLVLWAVAAYVWYQAWLWFEWVTWPTAVLTLAVFPIPFLAYRSFTGRTGLPMSAARGESPAGATSTTPAAPTSAPTEAPAGNPFTDWLIWLGNGEPHRGTLVVFIFLFWTLLYWSLPTISFGALTFAAWGLLTILGIMTLRFFFRPGREVSASGETKSRAK
jgi:hypothetical protein